MKVNKLDISKKIIKSPVKINSLSKDLKNKLKKEPGVSPGQNHSFKKIKISPKKIKSKQNHLFIPTSLSNKPIEDTNDVVVDKLIETIATQSKDMFTKTAIEAKKTDWKKPK